MFPKSVLAIGVLLLATAAAGPLLSTPPPPMALVSIITLQEPCVRQGGLCLHIDECEPSNRVNLPVVLCEGQGYLNVTCCYN